MKYIDELLYSSSDVRLGLAMVNVTLSEEFVTTLLFSKVYPVPSVLITKTSNAPSTAANSIAAWSDPSFLAPVPDVIPPDVAVFPYALASRSCLTGI